MISQRGSGTRHLGPGPIAQCPHCKDYAAQIINERETRDHLVLRTWRCRHCDRTHVTVARGRLYAGEESKNEYTTSCQEWTA